MKNKKEKGFTLVEMLIVVAIIGLLSSTVLLTIGPSRQRARDARRIADLRQIQGALENYNSSNNKYPGLATGASGTTDNLYDEIQGIPNDPQGGRYGYIRLSTQSYVLGACLELDRGSEIPTFAPDNAYLYDVTPQGSPVQPPPSCTCADTNAYCVAVGIGGR